jgi:hypothetical protein
MDYDPPAGVTLQEYLASAARLRRVPSAQYAWNHRRRPQTQLSIADCLARSTPRIGDLCEPDVELNYRDLPYPATFLPDSVALGYVTAGRIRMQATGNYPTLEDYLAGRVEPEEAQYPTEPPRM